MPDDKFWKDDDTQLMVMAAFRYCLGRQTYIVKAAIDWLWLHHRNFTELTKYTIVRDVIEAVADNQAGSPIIDAPAWLDLAEKVCGTLPSDRQVQLIEMAKRRDVIGGKFSAKTA